MAEKDPIQQELTEWMEKVRTQITARQKLEKFWASGFSASQLSIGEFRTVKIGPGGEIKMPLLTTKGSKKAFAAYSAMQVGRKRGKAPPREAIKQWIIDKGLTIEGSIDQVAFLIQRKIKEEGDQVKRGSRKGLDIEKIVAANAEELANIVGDKLLITISDVIDENLPVKSTGIS